LLSVTKEKIVKKISKKENFTKRVESREKLWNNPKKKESDGKANLEVV